MPAHGVLRAVAEWLQDLALLCTVVKPALLTITEFVLFFVGLVTLVWLALRAR